MSNKLQYVGTFIVGDTICWKQSLKDKYIVLDVHVDSVLIDKYRLQNLRTGTVFWYDMVTADTYMYLVENSLTGTVDKPTTKQACKDLVNPVHYPDAPVTKEECDNAFDILKQMCGG